MTIDRTQGDIKLILGEDGVDIDLRGGQPIMDTGIGNAVILSLLTEGGWAPDGLLEPTARFGGRFMAETRKPLQASRLAALQNAAIADLEWMMAEGVASNIQVIVRNPEHRRLEVAVMVWPPGQDAQVVLLSKYGQNWTSQELDPNALR